MPIVRFNVQKIEAKVRGNVRNIVSEAGTLLENAGQEMLNRHGSGRFYAKTQKAQAASRKMFFELNRQEVLNLITTPKIDQKISFGQRGEIFGARSALGVHQASAPGEPPAPDTANMRNNFQTDRSRLGETNPLVRVGNGGETGKIGRDLEYGTARIAPRPYLRPMVEQQRKAVIGLFTPERILKGLN